MITTQPPACRRLLTFSTTYTLMWLKDEWISARGTYHATQSPPHSAPSQLTTARSEPSPQPVAHNRQEQQQTRRHAGQHKAAKADTIACSSQQPAQHGHTAARSGPTRPQLNRITLCSNTTDRLPGHLGASSRPQRPIVPVRATTAATGSNAATGTLQHHRFAPPTIHRHHSRNTTDSVTQQGGDVATQPCPTYVKQGLQTATHSKPSRRKHDQSRVATRRTITVIASAARYAERDRGTVLAWSMSRQVDTSAVPCDQSQSSNKAKCRTTQHSATRRQCQTHMVKCATIS